MSIWLLLIAMACITFTSRYLLLMQSVPIILGPRVRRVLTYTAPAVLTALWVPIVFKPSLSLSEVIQPSYLVAAVVACILSRLFKNPLIAVLVSFAVFVFLNHFYEVT